MGAPTTCGGNIQGATNQQIEAACGGVVMGMVQKGIYGEKYTLELKTGSSAKTEEVMATQNCMDCMLTYKRVTKTPAPTADSSSAAGIFMIGSLLTSLIAMLF